MSPLMLVSARRKMKSAKSDELSLEVAESKGAATSLRAAMRVLAESFSSIEDIEHERLVFTLSSIECSAVKLSESGLVVLYLLLRPTIAFGDT